MKELLVIKYYFIRSQ